MITSDLSEWSQKLASLRSLCVHHQQLEDCWCTCLQLAGVTETFWPLFHPPFGLTLTALPSISCHQKPPSGSTFLIKAYLLRVLCMSSMEPKIGVSTEGFG